MTGFATIEDVKFRVIAVCHTCDRFHEITCGYSRMVAEGTDWERKHPLERGCRTEYACVQITTPKKLDDRLWNERGVGPAWMDLIYSGRYLPNANFNFVYRASAAITNALASLATSATLVAGYESAIIDNSTNKDLDILISALVTVGTTPTANTQIEIHSVSMRDDATWPDVFDGTTGAETITNVGVKDNICNPLGFLNCSAATSNVGYEMTKTSLASRYGGICPDKSVLFTVHNTGVNLNATGGNHVTTQQSVYILGA